MTLNDIPRTCATPKNGNLLKRAVLYFFVVFQTDKRGSRRDARFAHSSIVTFPLSPCRVAELASLRPDDFARTAWHGRLQEPMRLVDHVFFFAEHDDHHLARIWELRGVSGAAAK
jgi:hypothetical protein